MPTKYATKRPTRTKYEIKRDQADRDYENRIVELEDDKRILQLALSARLEPAPVVSHLGDLQTCLDNLRAVIHEVLPNSVSARAMKAIDDLRPWGRPPPVSGGVQDVSVPTATRVAAPATAAAAVADRACTNPGCAFTSDCPGWHARNPRQQGL